MDDRTAGMEAIHSGERVNEGVTRPKVPPIYASSVYSFETLADLDSVFDGEEPGYVYARMSHPNAGLLEETISALEGTESALVFSSGMAAITTAFLSVLKPGDHIIADRVLYGGSFSFINGFLRDWGISVDLVDTLDADSVRSSIKSNTKIIYLETISNPMMGVADIPALADLASAKGVMLFVDNTFATPVHCRPALMGADVVLHSLTKYLNGHSDVTGGVLAGNMEVTEKALKFRSTLGGSMSPFDAWLVHRGIRTLHLRMAAHSENALFLARALDEHPAVVRVEYPGLEKHGSHETARKVLRDGYGGMLSFEIRGGEKAASEFVERLGIVELVPSLASVSTTISHPAKTSHRALSEEQQRAAGITGGLIRLSVGIEPVEGIWADISNALDLKDQ